MLGEADFGIGPERPLEPEIDKQTLFTTEIALYCHPDYRLHKKRFAGKRFRAKS